MKEYYRFIKINYKDGTSSEIDTDGWTQFSRAKFASNWLYERNVKSVESYDIPPTPVMMTLVFEDGTEETSEWNVDLTYDMDQQVFGMNSRLNNKIVSYSWTI
jgi:hypothetical protein